MALKSEFTGSELGTYSAIPTITIRRKKEARRKRTLPFMEFRFAWQFYPISCEIFANGTDRKDTNRKTQAIRADRRTRFAPDLSRWKCDRSATRSIACQRIFPSTGTGVP